VVGVGSGLKSNQGRKWRLYKRAGMSTACQQPQQPTQPCRQQQQQQHTGTLTTTTITTTH
jgi:hypothetical protein